MVPELKNILPNRTCTCMNILTRAIVSSYTLLTIYRWSTKWGGNKKHSYYFAEYEY